MRQSDLDRIEEELELSLPATYREILLRFPFPPYSGTTELLSTDVDDLISVNKRLRERGFSRCPHWPVYFCAIGWDGCGNYYFMRLGEGDESVYLADHEGRCDPENLDILKETYSDLESYLQYVAEVEEEVRVDEEEVSEPESVDSAPVRSWWKRWFDRN